MKSWIIFFILIVFHNLSAGGTISAPEDTVRIRSKKDTSLSPYDKIVLGLRDLHFVDEPSRNLLEEPREPDYIQHTRISDLVTVIKIMMNDCATIFSTTVQRAFIEIKTVEEATTRAEAAMQERKNDIQILLGILSERNIACSDRLDKCWEDAWDNNFRDENVSNMENFVDAVRNFRKQLYDNLEKIV